MADEYGEDIDDYNEEQIENDFETEETPEEVIGETVDAGETLELSEVSEAPDEEEEEIIPLTPVEGRDPQLPDILMADEYIKEKIHDKVALFEKSLSQDLPEILRKHYLDIYEAILIVQEVSPMRECKIPLNLYQIADDAQQKFIHEKPQTNPIVIVTKINKFFDELLSIYIGGARKGNALIGELFAETCRLIRIAVLTTFSCKQILQMKLSDAGIDYCFNRMREFIIRAIMNPGENVGVLSGSSLGEPTSQLMFNTFHFAGVGENSKVNTGIERILQLANVTRTDNCGSNVFITIYLRAEDSINFDRIKQTIKNFNLNYIEDFVSDMSIIQDSLDTKIEEDKKMIKNFLKYADVPKIISPLAIRIIFNENYMFERMISQADIELRIHDDFSDFVLVSEQAGKMRIYTQNPGETLESMQQILRRLLRMRISGISGITGVEYSSYKHEGRLQNRKPIIYDRYILFTSGVNMIDMLSSPNIDTMNTVTNDVWGTYESLGIEATHNVLYDGYRTIFRSNGASVADEHIRILVDNQLVSGIPVPISRLGLAKNELETIQRASFEQPLNNYAEAALSGTREEMIHISDNVMYGQPANCGTGYFEILMN